MLTRQFFKNKRVTVFGLGLNGGGVATVKFLAKCGAKQIIVTDIKKRSELISSLEALKGLKSVTYILGQHRPEDFIRTDMVVVNPGIAWTNEYVKLALKNKVPVEMDASLFFQLCKRPIIGVTGTKGKTTTASLIAHILETAGHHVVRAGISQVPVLDVLDEVKARSVVVFELSSWRLSSLRRIHQSPHIAVFTNFFPDHLNYYKNLEDYARDKECIFSSQTSRDWLIYNHDNERVRTMVGKALSQKIAFSWKDTGERSGIFLRGDMLISRFNEQEKEVADVSRLSFLGEHQLSNVLGAVGAVVAYGSGNEAMIRKALKSFPGVPHRLEYIGEKRGVKYYNDSAATMPEAALSALQSFQEPIVLIAGGNNKGLDFSAFGEVIARKVKEVVFFKGEATEKLIKIVRKHLSEERKDKEFLIVESMDEAVKQAAALAEAGDVVLLSPGATSFGLFQNEFDRGDQFRKGVKMF